MFVILVFETLQVYSVRTTCCRASVRNTCFRVIVFSEFPRDRVSAPSPHSTVTPVTLSKFLLSQGTRICSRAKMSREESPFVRAPAEEEDYNSVHRAFLQAFHTHSVLTLDEMKSILAYVMTAYSLFPDL
jgi:hypothetical protein